MTEKLIEGCYEIRKLSRPAKLVAEKRGKKEFRKRPIKKKEIHDGEKCSSRNSTTFVHVHTVYLDARQVLHLVPWRCGRDGCERVSGGKWDREVCVWGGERGDRERRVNVAAKG
jgi:hypothetical protein